MSREIALEPLTAEAFAPYGDVIETRGEPSFQINAGMCDRFHDLARVDFDGEGTRIGISAGRGRPYALPYDLTMVERHPYGSQAFLPLGGGDWLVVVAEEACRQTAFRQQRIVHVVGVHLLIEIGPRRIVRGNRFAELVKLHGARASPVRPHAQPGPPPR